MAGNLVFTTELKTYILATVKSAKADISSGSPSSIALTKG